MMTLREFWKREGFTKAQAVDLAERGLILGAVQNPFSKQWTVEAPARLADWLQALLRPEVARAALPSSAEAIGAADAGLNPTQDGFGVEPLLLADQQAPEVRAEGLGLGFEDSWLPPDWSHSPQAEAPEAEPEAPLSIYRSPQIKQSCLCIHKAVARQNKRSCRLNLDAVELVHLFHAVKNARSKSKQAIARGLCKIGDLRATDSLWHKLQEAMQRTQQRRPA